MARLPQTIGELATGWFPRVKGFFSDPQGRIGFRATERGERWIHWFRLDLDRGGYILVGSTQSPGAGAWYYPLKKKNSTTLLRHFVASSKKNAKKKRKKKRRRGLDVEIRLWGDYVEFEILTARAKEWVDIHLVLTRPHWLPLEGYRWLSPKTFGVDWRYAKKLARAMANAGLKVR